MSKNAYYNSEGYADPTAYNGMKSVIREENEMERKVHTLVHILKDVADVAGFEITSRIHLKHKKTGIEYK